MHRSQLARRGTPNPARERRRLNQARRSQRLNLAVEYRLFQLEETRAALRATNPQQRQPHTSTNAPRRGRRPIRRSTARQSPKATDEADPAALRRSAEAGR